MARQPFIEAALVTGQIQLTECDLVELVQACPKACKVMTSAKPPLIDNCPAVGRNLIRNREEKNFIPLLIRTPLAAQRCIPNTAAHLPP